MLPAQMRPLILLTNDDGIQGGGLLALAEAMAEIGEVVVYAPDRNNSGVSHHVTLDRPLRIQPIRPGWFQVDGRPADCVYLAVHEHLKRRPSLVVSGINAGPNLSYDVHYSGTVGAAYEAALMGFPAIAVSLLGPSPFDFRPAARFAKDLAQTVLERGLPRDLILNVNVPQGEPTGFQWTFLGHRLFSHSVAKDEDPRGEPYYWVGGEAAPPMRIDGSDTHAVAEGRISVTPLSLDWTHQAALQGKMAAWSVSGKTPQMAVDPKMRPKEPPF